MLLGTVVFALIISTASMIAQNANMDDAAHGSKIALVHEFCSRWKLSEPLKYDILDFFLCSKDIFIENEVITVSGAFTFSVTGNVASAGSGSSHNNVQPTTICN